MKGSNLFKTICSTSTDNSYEIISAHEVVDAFGRERRLVKLKNYWTRVEFNYDFNNHDDENWTDELKEELGFGQS
jgi:hypothetical protein